MAIDDLAVAAGQDWNLEAELANAAAHAINSCVVLSGIAGGKSVCRSPDLNLHLGW